MNTVLKQQICKALIINRTKKRNLCLRQDERASKKFAMALLKTGEGES